MAIFNISEIFFQSYHVVLQPIVDSMNHPRKKENITLLISTLNESAHLLSFDIAGNSRLPAFPPVLLIASRAGDPQSLKLTQLSH